MIRFDQIQGIIVVFEAQYLVLFKLWLNEEILIRILTLIYFGPFEIGEQFNILAYLTLNLLYLLNLICWLWSVHHLICFLHAFLSIFLSSFDLFHELSLLSSLELLSFSHFISLLLESDILKFLLNSLSPLVLVIWIQYQVDYFPFQSPWILNQISIKLEGLSKSRPGLSVDIP